MTIYYITMDTIAHARGVKGRTALFRVSRGGQSNNTQSGGGQSRERSLRWASGECNTKAIHDI